jgi:hypothetical protein
LNMCKSSRRGTVTNLQNHRLIRLLTSLHLPTEDYVIFGSGPLLAHGLRDDISDVDIVARREAWQICADLRRPEPTLSGYGSMIRLYGGSLEIVDRWFSPLWDTDQLIENAQIIGGLPFAPLTEVVASKWATGRPKDHTDLDLIRAYTRQLATTGGQQ